MFELRPYRRNTMSTWNPFSEMEEMERRFFNNDFFTGRGPGGVQDRHHR